MERRRWAGLLVRGGEGGVRAMGARACRRAPAAASICFSPILGLGDALGRGAACGREQQQDQPPRDHRRRVFGRRVTEAGREAESGSCGGVAPAPASEIQADARSIRQESACQRKEEVANRCPNVFTGNGGGGVCVRERGWRRRDLFERAPPLPAPRRRPARSPTGTRSSPLHPPPSLHNHSSPLPPPPPPPHPPL